MATMVTLLMGNYQLDMTLAAACDVDVADHCTMEKNTRQGGIVLPPSITVACCCVYVTCGAYCTSAETITRLFDYFVSITLFNSLIRYSNNR